MRDRVRLRTLQMRAVRRDGDLSAVAERVQYASGSKLLPVLANERRKEDSVLVVGCIRAQTLCASMFHPYAHPYIFNKRMTH